MTPANDAPLPDALSDDERLLLTSLEWDRRVYTGMTAQRWVDALNGLMKKGYVEDEDGTESITPEGTAAIDAILLPPAPPPAGLGGGGPAPDVSDERHYWVADEPLRVVERHINVDVLSGPYLTQADAQQEVGRITKMRTPHDVWTVQGGYSPAIPQAPDSPTREAEPRSVNLTGVGNAIAKIQSIIQDMRTDNLITDEQEMLAIEKASELSDLFYGFFFTVPQPPSTPAEIAHAEAILNEHFPELKPGYTAARGVLAGLNDEPAEVSVRRLRDGALPVTPGSSATGAKRAARSKMVPCGTLKAGDYILYPGSKYNYTLVERAELRPGIAEITVKARKQPFLFGRDAMIRARITKGDSNV